MAEVTIERLRETPLANRLTEEELDSLLPHVQERALAKGETLFRPGDAAAHLYYVEDGCVWEGSAEPAGPMLLPRRAVAGKYIGRFATVTGQPYHAMATADEDSVLLAFPLRHLQPILFSHADWRKWFLKIDTAQRLRAMPLFMDFADWDMYVLADEIVIQDHSPDSIIYEASDPVDSLYIVDLGRVEETGPQTRFVSAGNTFGLTDFKAGQRPRTQAKAKTQTRLFRVPEQVLQSSGATHAGDLHQILRKTDVTRHLATVPLFSGLDRDKLQLLAGYVSLVFHPPGDIVARQGEPATSLMVMYEGEAIVRRQVGQERPRPVTYFKADPKGGSSQEAIYFGDHALLAEEMRGATVEAMRPSAWIVLERSDFEQFMADGQVSADELKYTPPIAEAARQAPAVQADYLPLPHLVRRHWIVPVTNVVPLVFFVLLIALLLLIGEGSFPSGLLHNIATYGGLVAIVLLSLWAVYRYVDWWNDTYEVTNQAVIHSERQLFFSEERYEIPLQQIQNVNILISALGRLLGYGDVSIDTAAARGQIDFTKIPDPAFVQSLIQSASAQARSGQRVQIRESIRQKLEDQLNPERLKPAIPGSVLIRPEPETPRPSRLGRFGTLRGWFPRFEIREADRVTWRKHWINLVVRTGLPGLALFLASYLVFAFTLAFLSETFGQGSPLELPPVSWFGFQGWLFFVLLVLWITAFLWFLYQYIDWRNDIYILTENEIIDVERELAMFPFFFLYTENRRQASLANVQFVDFRIPHPVAMILRYGDVVIQTAGAEGILTFLTVSNPSHVHQEILSRLASFQERQRESEFQERWKDMAEWFEAYESYVDQTKPEGG